jgi:hypothetical protein
MLAPGDEAYLRDKGLEFEIFTDQGLICVVIKDYPLPSGYDVRTTDVLLRLPPGFPDAQPDMFWCNPPVRLGASGNYPQAADLMEQYLGNTWQRFSRHLNPGVWKPGTDSLGSYMALIGAELERSVGGPR